MTTVEEFKKDLMEFRKNIKESKEHLQKYITLYDDIYCISHHREYAEIVFERYSAIFKQKDNEINDVINLLYEMKTNLLHESTKVFHNIYRFIFYNEQQPEFHINGMLFVFKELSWVVEKCREFIYNIENQYIKIDPKLEIDYAMIGANYLSNIDFENIPTSNIIKLATDLYSNIFETYVNDFKLYYDKVDKMIDKKYGFVPYIRNFYKYILNQINHLAGVIFTNAHDLYDNTIGIDILRVTEYIKPWMIIEYLNLLSLNKALLALRKCLNIGFLDEEDLNSVSSEPDK